MEKIKISLKEFENRIQRLKKKMEEQEMDPTLTMREGNLFHVV